MLIGLRDISVAYPGTLALDQVSLDIDSGDVLAVVGANGSGKTTLLSTLCGLRAPTSGQMLVEDGPVRFRGPSDALARGIAMVPQEPQIAESLPVWENLLIGSSRLLGLAPGRKNRVAAKKHLAEALPHVDPDQPAGNLRKADRAVLGLLRALHSSPVVLALDEPTAVLGENSVEVVNGATRAVRSAGGATVLVSHRLRDIIQLATRVVVLVDGRLVHDSPIAEVSIKDLVDKMAAGRSGARAAAEIHDVSDDPAPGTEGSKPPDNTVELDGVTSASGLDVGRLTISPGSILGVVGLAGSGRSRLCRVLTGHESYRGTITLGGVPVPRSSRSRSRSGIGYIPEDRAREAIFESLSVARNLEVGELVRTSLGSLIPIRPDAQRTNSLIQRFGIRTASLGTGITALSGGNQQRVVVARVLSHRPRVLVADEPTQGVDRVGRAAIHEMIRQFASEGGAVLFVSSEFEELQEVATYLAVLVDGRVTAFRKPSTEYRELVALATGTYAERADGTDGAKETGDDHQHTR